MGSAPSVSNHDSICPQCAAKRMAFGEGGTHTFCLDCGSVPAAVDLQKRGQMVVEKALARGPASALRWDIGKNKHGTRNSNELINHWLQWAKPCDQTETNFAHSLSELTRISIVMSLPQTVVERAANLSSITFQERLVRGRTVRAISAAVVYIACRQIGEGITLIELGRVSGIEPAKIGHCCGVVQTYLRLTLPEPKPVQYLPRILTRLELSEETSERLGKTTEALLERIERRGLVSGKDPTGIVAGALYEASRIHRVDITQRELAASSGVTEVTVRNRAKEIATLTKDLIQNDSRACLSS